MIDLSKIAESASPESKRLFGAYVRAKQRRWRELIGQRIIHEFLGEGEIIDLQHSPILHQPCLYIKFAHEIRHFKIPQFIDDPYVLTLTLSQETVANIRQIVKQIRIRRTEREKREQERLEAIRIEDELREAQQQQKEREEAQRQKEEAEQRERESEANQDFERLKSKYLAEGYKDSSPSNLLYIILLQIEDKDFIDETQIAWLKEHELFGTLAHYYQNIYRRCRDPWLLVQASSCWRDAGQSERVITLTNFLLEQVDPLDARLRSAIFTTRGGAFRDLGNWGSAEECANQAIQFNESTFQPYNLLGAIYFERGMPEKGEEAFRKAMELGAQPNIQEKQMKAALKSAGQLERKIVAEYLLRKDPKRYSWANYYLKH